MAEKTLRLTRTVLVLSIAIIFSLYARAHGGHSGHHDRDDDDDDDDHDNEDTPDPCGPSCGHGCCDHLCCSHDEPDEVNGQGSSNTLKIVGVVGGILAVMTLIALCVLRYRCLAKVRERATVNYARASRRHPATRCSSIFALNVESQNLERLANRLSNAECTGSSTMGGQLVQPPPYSVHDPFTSPACDGEPSCQNQLGELPPAYADVVKNVVFVVEEEASTQERSQGNLARDETENSTPEEPGRGNSTQDDTERTVSAEPVRGNSTREENEQPQNQ